MEDVALQTVPPRAEIEAALARIQQWPGLSRSPQLAKFLNYIVGARLDGNEASIKAYSIAVDVFGRPQSFDPQHDPIVRVQARRLRAALDEYYSQDGADESVRFHLPVGRYIPEFSIPEEGAGESAAVAAPRYPTSGVTQRPLLARLDDIVLLVVLIGVALGIAIVMTQVLAPRPARLAVPQPPKIAIAEFTSVSAGDSPAVSVAGLAVELVTDLSLFPFIDAVYLRRPDAGVAEAGAPPFELTGIARSEGEKVQITASLKRSDSDTAVWSMTKEVPLDQLSTSIDSLSQAFADQLGAVNGPLHRDAIGWLQTSPDLAGNETEYVCGLLFTLYRDTGEQGQGERARSCLAGLQRGQPKSALVLSMSGALLLDKSMRLQAPFRSDPEPVAEAERQIKEALALAPTSSQVWLEYAFFLQARTRPGEAEAAFTSALQLNPSNLDAVAGHARLLSLRGRSDKAVSEAREALRRALTPPYWYHEAAAINALRSSDNIVALSEADGLASGDAELASVIATVAAHRLGSQDVLNRSIAQLLEVARFRRNGIMPVVRSRITDTELSARIGRELAAAGIDQQALNGPY